MAVPIARTNSIVMTSETDGAYHRMVLIIVLIAVSSTVNLKTFAGV